MDYLKIYNQLINKANRRNAEDGIYYEAHHIVPRCMGGGSDKTNLVKLTAKEHFIAHKLLVEIYPTNGKLIHAYWLMANNKNDDRREYIVGSREYERLKTKHAELISKLFKGVPKVWKDNKVRSKKIGNFHRNKIISDDTRNLISTGLKEYYSNNPSASIGKSHSEETRKK